MIFQGDARSKPTRRVSRAIALAVAILLVAVDLTPVGAEPTSTLVTCINLQTKTERISKTGKCRITHEAQAKWHLLQSDSRLPEKDKSKTLVICSNKPTSSVSYEIIRAHCARHQLRSEFYRSNLLVPAPKITNVVATGHDSAQISVAADPNANPDAPVAYYEITSSKGQVKNVYTWGELTLTIDSLSELTDYSFAVSATTADGTSQLSLPSDSVKTAKYVAPPAPASAAAPVAQVSIVSNETATVSIPVGATTVVVSAAALGNPTLSVANQSSVVSATFQSISNPVGGSSTPFTVSGSTKIVDISVSGLTGSATVCLDASPTAKLWHFVGGAWVDITTSRTSTQVCGVTSSFSPFTGEDQLGAPAFSLSVNSRTANVGSAMVSVTATKTAHSQVVTYSVSPALPSGISINSSTGTISGTPSASSAATNYTITATNAALGTATQTLSLTVDAALSCIEGGACVLGEAGPGGGTIFYVSVAGFDCGPEFNSTGSPTGGKCHYLEMRKDDLGQKAIASSSGDYWPADVSNEIGSGYKNTVDQIYVLSNCSTLCVGGTPINGAVGTTWALPATRATYGGKSDWYLPSLNELLALISYASPLNRSYWTSSRTRRDYAGLVRTSPGGGGGDSWQNDATWYVLPIRAF